MAALQAVKAKLRSENQLSHYRPYNKQKAFHALSKRERALIAANQSGKTYSASMEVAMHLTGRYPDWWTGKRFNGPTNWLAGSESGELTKKGIQRLLFGRDIKTALGTGSIPAECIERTSCGHAAADLIDTAHIRHDSGGISTIALKSYEQGRGKWQADTVDGIWFDEEPPADIYTEGLTRTNIGLGPILLTLTPLLGNTQIIMRFMGDKPIPGTGYVMMTLDDAEHYTQEQREAIIASYPPHELETRTKGLPMRGSGAVFPVMESAIRCTPMKIPEHWPQIIGIDFGVDHPSAGALLAWDRDADVVYVTHVYRQSDVSIPEVASALKRWGHWIPVAWPHDGLQRDKSSLIQIAQLYRQEGLLMLPEKASFEDGSNGFEAGIQDMLTRMQTGRFKVFDTCPEFFEEFRLYHRDKGRVCKITDDIISAVRYGCMMLRDAETKPNYQPRSSGYDNNDGPNAWMGR